jgi:hypothetical protein
MKVTLAVYKCICCGHSDRVTGEKEDYSEVKVCPKCNGAFVDSYHIAKYKQVNDLKPLLEITVTDLNSVPVIKYKGETINNLDYVNYNWSTRTAKENGNHSLHFKHYYSDDCGFPFTRTVGESRC